MSFAAIAAGVTAGLKTVVQGSQRNQTILTNAKRYGVDLANADYRTTTALAATGENLLANQANALTTSNTLALNTQAQQASVSVSQAATGTTGGSAEMIKEQNTRNEVIAQEQSARQFEDKASQIQAQAEDTLVGIQTQTQSAPTATPQRTLLLGGLSGLTTYGSLGGFS